MRPPRPAHGRRPGPGPALRDKGLAELLGKQVEDTNTKAERNSIRLLLSQQPIEIICRLKIDESQKDNRGGRRYPSKLYPRDSVLAFLDACSPEYLGVEASDTLRKIVTVQTTASYVPPHLCDDASPNQGGHHGKTPRAYVLG